MCAAEEVRRGWDEHLFSGDLCSVDSHFAAVSVWL